MTPALDKQLLTRFFAEVVSFRRRLLAVVIALMIASGLGEAASFALLVPLLALAGVASGGGGRLEQWAPASVGGSPFSLEAALALFVAVMLARIAIGYATTIASNRYMALYVEHKRRSLYAALSRASWLHLAEGQRAAETHSLTMKAENAGTAVSYALAVASAATLMLAAGVVALVAAPRLSIVVLALALIAAAPVVWQQMSAYRESAAVIAAMEALFDKLRVRMSGIKLAKAFSIEAKLEREFGATTAGYRQAWMTLTTTNARARAMQEVAAAIVLAGFVYAGVRLFSTPGADLVLLIAIAARLLPLANSLVTSARAFTASLADYAALDAEEHAARAAAVPVAPVHARIRLHDRIDLAGISFAYPGRAAHPAVDSVDLTIAARTSVGLVGPSGAGKTTLADILAGLVVPHRGILSIDGQAIGPDHLARWRRSVAYIPQSSPLLYDTVRANLMLGVEAAHDDALWTVLKAAHAADLVRRLPRGLDTIVGDQAVQLSGGEKQRLLLASALLVEPDLLLLDEATNALSPADEAEIIAALRDLKARTTIIVIAHRFSSVDWTDRIIAIEAGRIAADGTPAHVLSR